MAELESVLSELNQTIKDLNADLREIIRIGDEIINN